MSEPAIPDGWPEGTKHASWGPCDTASYKGACRRRGEAWALHYMERVAELETDLVDSRADAEAAYLMFEKGEGVCNEREQVFQKRIAEVQSENTKLCAGFIAAMEQLTGPPGENPEQTAAIAAAYGLVDVESRRGIVVSSAKETP